MKSSTKPTPKPTSKAPKSRKPVQARPRRTAAERQPKAAKPQPQPAVITAPPPLNPTQKTYKTLDDCYRFFNEKLFDNRLPPCLITMQRTRGAGGYFSGGRFGKVDGTEVTDEIALNPTRFRELSAEFLLSILVHEMVHLQQYHFGNRVRIAYHDQQWASMMLAVGLIPSDTGEPGGKMTGAKVSHYVQPDGRFAKAAAALLEAGYDPLYVDLKVDVAAKKKKAASKTKYSCPYTDCKLNAWAKEDVKLICGTHHLLMVAQKPASGSEADEPNRKDAA